MSARSLPAVGVAADGRGGSLDEAIARAQSWLLGRQHEEGYWQAPLEANAGMDAQYMIFNRFMGRHDEAIERRLVEHMLAKQADDGSWPLFHGGPGHTSTTIEAYFALKLAGRSPDEPRLRSAREFILAQGGLACAGVFTRFFLAYFDQFPWRGVPAIPVEMILLPDRFPLSIYRMSSWARETLVPLTVLAALQPRVAVDRGSEVGELWTAPPARSDLGFSPASGWFSWSRFFLLMDRTLRLCGRFPWKPLRTRALRCAEEWILSHQDRDGGWGGIQPPMLNCVMALRALGYAPDHPAVIAGCRAVDDFLIEHDGHLLFQPCVSPTWDTALVAKALLDSGCDARHRALVRAADWLIARQIFEGGDWRIYNPGLEAGGWAFEFVNDWYPDVDDTAVILMVLRRVAASSPARRDRAIASGMNWVLGMQSRNGGWAAFDVNNVSAFLNDIPFADMKAMIDPPTEDITGRGLELLGRYGFRVDFGCAARARDFLRRTQRANGSWWGRWGANFIYGTWSALSGLRAIGERTDMPYIRRAVRWLKQVQNADGGWGESLRSYDDERLAGRGESTASQTAWALLGLLAGEDGVSLEAERGIRYLLSTQGADGTWREAAFTGTGFPGHFYLRYDMYRSYFPLMALGQFRARLGGTGALGWERRAAASRSAVNGATVAGELG